MLELCWSSLEGVGMHWNGVGVYWRVLEWCVTSGSDPRGTRNADSDGRPKQSRTSEDESERRGIEAGVRLDVDKHAGGP